MVSHSFVAAHTITLKNLGRFWSPFFLFCAHPQNKMGCRTSKNAYAEEEEGANPNEVVAFEAPAEEPAEDGRGRRGRTPGAVWRQFLIKHMFLMFFNENH